MSPPFVQVPSPVHLAVPLVTWKFKLAWGGGGVIKTHTTCSTHIFTTIKTVLLGSHELSKHSLVVISLLLVVQLSRAAGEGCVVLQDQLKTSLVGGVAVGAVVRLHGDLDQGRVADLCAAVSRAATGHVRPAV